MLQSRSYSTTQILHCTLVSNKKQRVSGLLKDSKTWEVSLWLTGFNIWMLCAFLCFFLSDHNKLWLSWLFLISVALWKYHLASCLVCVGFSLVQKKQWNSCKMPASLHEYGNASLGWLPSPSLGLRIGGYSGIAVLNQLSWRRMTYACGLLTLQSLGLGRSVCFSCDLWASKRWLGFCLLCGCCWCYDFLVDG
jgi:hypothetical protein